MTPVEHLRKAKAVLKDPTKWTKGSYARDAKGHVVPTFSPDAVAWCAEGAMWLTHDGLSGASTYLDRVIPKPFEGIPAYNDDDGTSYQDLLAWFDRAIKLAERCGQ